MALEQLNESPLTDDLLRGLQKIGDFIGESEIRTKRLIERRVIPAWRPGHEYIASKRQLRKRVEELTAGFIGDAV
jgi:hypothetical protein